MMSVSVSEFPKRKELESEAKLLLQKREEEILKQSEQLKQVQLY